MSCFLNFTFHSILKHSVRNARALRRAFVAILCRSTVEELWIFSSSLLAPKSLAAACAFTHDVVFSAEIETGNATSLAAKQKRRINYKILARNTPNAFQEDGAENGKVRISVG